MAQIIAFINMKGGVAKTTLAVNVAYGLAWIHGKKVLIVDGDPQFNATQYLLEDQVYLDHLEDTNKGTILDVFKPRRPGKVSTVTGTSKSANKAKMPLANCTCRIFKRGEAFLDLMPSTLNLIELEQSERGTERKLKNYLDQTASNYNYVIIDCPPTVSIFTQAAILASSKFLVPVKPDLLSVIGLPLLERWLEDYTETHGISPEMIGLVFTLVRGQLPRGMRELRASRGDAVFRPELTESKYVANSVEAHKPVFRFAPSSNAALEIKAITQEFLNRTPE